MIQTHDSAGHGVGGDGVEELAAPAAGRVVGAVDLDVALGTNELQSRNCCQSWIVCIVSMVILMRSDTLKDVQKSDMQGDTSVRGLGYVNSVPSQANEMEVMST